MTKPHKEEIQDPVDKLFFQELRGKTITEEQAYILEWAEKRLKPAVRRLIEQERAEADMRSRHKAYMDIVSKAGNGATVRDYATSRAAECNREIVRLTALQTNKED